MLTQYEDKQVVPLLINGKAQPTHPERFIEVYSSAQQKIVHYAQGASVEDAQNAASTAAAAFVSWKATKYTERRALLLRTADIFESRVDEIAQYQMEETSCSENFARFNVKVACDSLREFAGSVTVALTGNSPPMLASGYGLVFKEAIGPVLVIPPWNSSIILSTRGVAAAIAAGCTVVLKASELCPRTHQMVVECFEQAGLPAGCISQVQADRANAAAVTEALISHDAIKKIDFIGSASVGRIIGQVAAKYLKPVLMELGGKGPSIVLKDADLQKAAELSAFGAFVHAGQICMSTERIIVVREVAEQFKTLLQQEVEKNFSSSAGYTVTTTGAARAQSMLEDSRKNGATFIVGDNSFIDSTKAALRPTIIEGVQKSDALWDEETFGPSASFYVVENAQEAVELANASKYGLNAVIHTTDYMTGLDLSRALDYGQVHINTTTVFDQVTLPISGYKCSGWGSTNSHYGIEEFLINKSVTIHRPDEGLTFGV